MKTEDIIQLGDPRLYQKCTPVKESELPLVLEYRDQMAKLIEEVRKKYGFGRGIAAPQLGIMKRFFVLNIDNPSIFINPRFEYKSPEKFRLWDDCMSFPNLRVQLERHTNIRIVYMDSSWTQVHLEASGDMSELIQHEMDHLDGILSINRAGGSSDFKWEK